MIKKTACPLDCYDACSIEYDSEIKPSSSAYTQGYLCSHMNNYTKLNTIISPRYKGENISYEKAFDILYGMLDLPNKSNILHYRGSGNVGLMQEVTDHFFAKIGATLTDGSLCDGAGDAGIREGRGINKNMPLSEIDKAEVIILWGRNPHTTSSHLLPIMKNKKVIVVDPVKIDAANRADLHIQLKPHGDLDLALLICRFLYINDSIDEEFLKEYASEYEEFYELTQSIRIKAKLESIDVDLGQIGDFIKLVTNKKVAIVCGLGFQKYSDGADVMRAIDSIAVLLGLFGKEGCGVSYLGNSKENIQSPFYSKSKKESSVNTMFSIYKTVFIQSANPLSQMPDTSRVERSIQKVDNIVYFGLYENETSAIAHLVIPAKQFLFKDDIRVSYSHNDIQVMNKIDDSATGISEYDLSSKLSSHFGIEMESEEYYLEYFQQYFQEQEDGVFRVKGREDIPYKNGFDTDDGEFLFLDEYENSKECDDKLFLITPKSRKSLNSQFQCETDVFLHSSLGYEEGDALNIKSINGEIQLSVSHNDNLRTDCILIYSGTPLLNHLTSSRHSLDGKCAIFQENKVNISKV